jgi:hypothetical protein
MTELPEDTYLASIAYNNGVLGLDQIEAIHKLAKDGDESVEIDA